MMENLNNLEKIKKGISFLADQVNMIDSTNFVTDSPQPDDPRFGIMISESIYGNDESFDILNNAYDEIREELIQKIILLTTSALIFEVIEEAKKFRGNTSKEKIKTYLKNSELEYEKIEIAIGIANALTGKSQLPIDIHDLNKVREEEKSNE